MQEDDPHLQARLEEMQNSVVSWKDSDLYRGHKRRDRRVFLFVLKHGLGALCLTIIFLITGVPWLIFLAVWLPLRTLTNDPWPLIGGLGVMLGVTFVIAAAAAFEADYKKSGMTRGPISCF